MNLSIVIPTYNRPEKLLRVLQALQNQLKHHQVQILVIDNCSDVNIGDFLKSSNLDFDSLHSRVVRNSGNVGLGGNILMAFLQCQTKWMWLLGDDDIPHERAIEKIKNELDKIKEDYFAIKFNSHAGGFPKTEEFFNIITISNCLEYLSNHSYYSNFLFISNSVYNVEEFRKYIFHMANGLRTIAPHVIASLNLLSENKKMKLVDEFIVQHGRVEKGDGNWSYARLISGVVYLYDSDIPVRFKLRFIPVLLNNYISSGKNSTKRYVGFVLKMFEKVDGQYFLLKSAGIHKGWFSNNLLIAHHILSIPGLYTFFSKQLVSNKKGISDLLRN